MSFIQFNRFPGGRAMALTFSYDDGQIFDRRLVALMNRYGLRGAFHLISDRLGQPGFIMPEEVAALYALHRLVVSAKGDLVYNPTATAVYFTVKDKTIYLPGGEIWRESTLSY